MFVRSLLGLFLFLTAWGSVPPEAPEASATVEDRYWVQPLPRDNAETALRALVESTVSLPPTDRAAALARLTRDHQHSQASGLAQLAAGLILMEADRHPDALLHLNHPDVAATPVRDHAALAQARSYEKTGDFQQAYARYRDVIEVSPASSLSCGALLRGAELGALVGKLDQAKEMLEQALASCPGREPQALVQLALVADKAGDPRKAALHLDRLDSEHPGSTQARDGAARLRTLAAHVPPVSPEAKNARDIKKAEALMSSGRHGEAAPLLRALSLRVLDDDQREQVRVRLGRTLLELGREKDARTFLTSITAASPYAAEAAYLLARLQAQRSKSTAPYEVVAARFPKTAWAEEALLSLAHNQQKEGRDAQALPYYRRLYEDFPQGRLIDRATWRVGIAAYKASRHEEAAQIFEKAARERVKTSYTSAFLYWAARARRELGQDAEADKLFRETVTRYKHGYHGQKAREALGLLPGGSSSTHPVDQPAGEMAEPHRSRVRSLLLVDRLPEALEELRGAPVTRQAQATSAWIQWRQGNLRPAITAMKRAYPDYITELGDQLPEPVWRILYPIHYSERLTKEAAKAGLDPALVAALICQESTFDASAVSGVGARGLMQLMPPTGRELARRAGRPFSVETLHDPDAGLELGIRYLKQMVDSFGGRVERALAAYNAGPNRVATWTAGRRNMSAEEFVDSIPYPETRGYVMTILAARDEYRRLYGLPPVSALGTIAQNGLPPELLGADAPRPAISRVVSAAPAEKADAPVVKAAAPVTKKGSGRKAAAPKREARAKKGGAGAKKATASKGVKKKPAPRAKKPRTVRKSRTR